MIFQLLLIGIFFCNNAQGYESESAEANRIEAIPFYDTIIFNDVADIINEFENNMKTPLEALMNSGSDSDENIEDLLAEYQHYLDKAHKQRTNYLEKTKVKNKVPLLRHDRYTKTKPGTNKNYDDNYYATSYYTPSKLSQMTINNPIDLFIPISPKLRLFNKSELTTIQPKENYEELANFEKRLIDIPTGIPALGREPIKPNCICKSQYPCDCKCKQCIIFESLPQSSIQYSKFLSSDGTNKPSFQAPNFVMDDKSSDMAENSFNIRIKVDIQLPKLQDVLGKIFRNRSRDDDGNSKETNINVPFPYFNFPIPMDLSGYKRIQKINKHDSAPLHKITIHRKKKSRASNGNKKHKKKLITFHNFNIDSQPPLKIKSVFEENINLSDYVSKFNNSNKTVLTDTNTSVPEKVDSDFNYTYIVNKTEKAIVVNETQTEESIYLTVNISNSNDNGTEDMHKNENSVETDFTKTDSNIPTEGLSNTRKKREISTEKISELIVTRKNDTTGVNDKLSLNKNNETKKADKGLLLDAELLYWPDSPRNQTVIPSRNITTIILDRENKKVKLNMTKETIRHNRTRVLERAIFGDVIWDDVDTVAPVFMSFVGKYVTGILTFCSQNVCHSMKCAEKTCVHRICTPKDRWNQRGHCAGSNSTDSVASLESIMDLPSNIAFEIVDILQDKMLGKLFGEVTLCISTKCISFVVSKKFFLKSKCSVKELTKAGHCQNIKSIKNM